MILNCFPAQDNPPPKKNLSTKTERTSKLTKNYPEPHFDRCHSFFFFVIQMVSKPVLRVCQHCLVGCPHMKLCIGIGLGACTHKNALILVGSQIRTRHNPLSRSWTRLALPSALVGQKKHVENSPSEETWTETCLMSINTQAHDSVCNLKALCFMAESKVASVPQADRWLNIRVGPR